MDRATLTYNPDTDVVQVQTSEQIPESTIAIPSEDITFVMSRDLNELVGFDIQDLPTFVERYLPAGLVPDGVEGEELFEKVRHHIEPFVSLMARNMAAYARDRVRHWQDLSARREQTRG
jgi:hypothetical protein